jgi:hypothetical protein
MTIIITFLVDHLSDILYHSVIARLKATSCDAYVTHLALLVTVFHAFLALFLESLRVSLGLLSQNPLALYDVLCYRFLKLAHPSYSILGVRIGMGRVQVSSVALGASPSDWANLDITRFYHWMSR